MYEAGYQYEYAGENLAKNFLFSKNVVEAWMDSPTHRENVLRPEYTDVGFAVVNDVLNGEETTLVVQMFGKPLKNTTASVVENKPARPINIAGVQQAPIKKVNAPFNIFWFFVIFLTLVLITDFYAAFKFGIIRLHGKNLPHIIFLIFASVGFFLFLARGSIL
jgi:hypothetical protein